MSERDDVMAACLEALLACEGGIVLLAAQGSPKAKAALDKLNGAIVKMAAAGYPLSRRAA